MSDDKKAIDVLPGHMSVSAVRVERNLFFRRPQAATHRYTEHSPPAVHEHGHHSCNCTKNVSVRPDGNPDWMTQEITLEHPPIGELRPEFRLCENWLNFSWGLPRSHDEAITRPHDHASFGWTRGGLHGTQNLGQRSVRVGITLPGHGPTDWFGAGLYMGNRIDVSTLRNGWMPSQIVDISKLGETDLWLYDCWSGDERMRVMPASDETRMWLKALLEVEAIHARTKVYRENFASPIDELRRGVEDDVDLSDRVGSIIRTMANVVTTIRSTELFQISEEMTSTLRSVVHAAELQ